MGSNATWGAMFQSVASKVKAAYLNVTDTELKVLDATNEEPWGPHGSVMAEIARLAERPDQYNEVMGILHQRLQERDERWRMCYKALLLLEYLCKQGPLRVASDLSRSVHILESLRDMFEYKDLQGRDHGVNVRQRAKELVMLVNSPQRLQEEREKAQKNAGKYRGVSATEMRVGGYGGGGGGGGYGTGGSHSGSGYGSGGGGGGGGYGSSSFGSGQDGAGPSYGRAQSEMSSHRRHGSGQSAPAGTEEGDDPFEATRKRIERLKADGTIAEPPREPPSQGISGTLVDPVPTDKKGPKKLSDVKIDPKFATTIASLAPPPTQRTAPVVALPPPPGSRAALGLAKPSSQGGGAPAVPPASTSSSALDLLGDLTLPTPAPAPGLAPPPASTGAAAGLGFAAAPAPAARAPGGDGFDMLAGFGGSSAATAAAPKPPAAASPFDDLLFGPSTTAPAPAPAAPKPAAFPAPAPASAADPFAVLAAAAAPKVAASSGFDALLTPSAVPAPAQPLAAAPAFAAARPPLDDFFAAPTTTTTTAAAAAPTSTPDPFAHMLGGSGLAGNGGGFGAPAAAAPAAPAPGLALGGVGAPMVPKPMTGAPPPPSMASKDPFAGLGF